MLSQHCQTFHPALAATACCAAGYTCPAGQKCATSKTNDVFAFFAWAGSQIRDSIALLPGTSTYVSIISVNPRPENSLYYRSNVGNTLKTEMDGLTAMLNTSTVLGPLVRSTHSRLPSRMVARAIWIHWCGSRQGH
jgi:hypothetical protein